MAEEQPRKEERERGKQRAAKTEDESAPREPSERAAQLAEQAKAGAEQLKERVRQRDWMRPLRASLPKLKNLQRKLAPRPRIHVIDRDDELVVRAEVPGIAKEQLDVALTDGTLLIRAEEPRAENGGRSQRREFRPRGFERRLILPCAVAAERASGSVRDGVLELVLPKSEQARRHSIALR